MDEIAKITAEHMTTLSTLVQQVAERVNEVSRRLSIIEIRLDMLEDEEIETCGN